MGVIGIAFNYRPSYSNQIYARIHIIIHFLPELHRKFLLTDSTLFGREIIYYVQTIEDVLRRYTGTIDEKVTSKKAPLRNPLIWFTEGVKSILAFPLYILVSFGIFGTKLLESIVNSNLFKILSGLVALIGFASAIITIVVGYEDFISIIKELFRR